LLTEDKAEAKDAPKATLDFALTRTILAADRTLMAWIRTAFTFLGFGSTI
jgi:putative membrane protein